jgi:hypothetical protein
LLHLSCAILLTQLKQLHQTLVLGLLDMRLFVEVAVEDQAKQVAVVEVELFRLASLFQTQEMSL